MENENNHFMRNDVFSKRIRAGKRRTYFFDVRTTKGNDYYLTITESKKRFHDDGYDRHKIFVYKEDFNKFIHTLEGVVNHIKENLMPDYDFDAFTRDPEDITYDGTNNNNGQFAANNTPEPVSEPVAETTAEVTETVPEVTEEVSAAGEASTESSIEAESGGNEEEVMSWD